MKKSFILFIMMLMIGLSTGCGDFWAAGVRLYDVESFEVSADYTNALIISVDMGKVTINNGNVTNIEIVMSNFVDAGGYTVGMEYLENNIDFTFETNNGMINITHNQYGSDSIDNWNIYGLGSKVYVTLPEGISFLTQTIHSTVGEIELFNDNYAGEIDLETDTGRIEVAALSGNNVFVRTDTGSIEIEDLIADTVELDSDTGSVEFGQVECGVFDVSVRTGSIDGDHDGYVKAETVNFNCNTGSIDVKLVGLKVLNAITTTGSVSVNIESFSGTGNSFISTETGTIDLDVDPRATDNLKVTVSTGTGSINNKIDFTHVLNDRLTSFEGYNGNGLNEINTDTGTGSVTIKSK